MDIALNTWNKGENELKIKVELSRIWNETFLVV